MAIHLQRDLEKLKKDILLLGTMVEEATNRSVLALMDRRSDLAREIQQGDKEIDVREIRIEEDCLKILALHQPVANDLRFVVTVMKVNNDLERVGDLAGNLAGRAIFLADQPPVDIPDGIRELAESVPKMLRESLDALIQQDTDLARQILADDEQVDQVHKDLYSHLEGRMQEDHDQIPKLIQLLSVSRYLERIADLATNIAEDVVFLVDGDVVRHRSWDVQRNG
ncbi:MAG: phosphate signaling complex protein PhoU [Thermoanaerobaculia bacterium]|nr:phosphate signaling complex protein PhoU [Thermoanaerobaculia bacterium]